MSIVTRLRFWLARGLVKTMAWPLVPQWARYSFMRPTFRALTQEGYKANGAVFACISTLAFAFHEPVLKIWERDDSGLRPLARHPLEALLHRPNPQMGLAELLQYTITYMAIGGNCYWYKVRSRAGRVVRLWPLHDGVITPVPGGDVLVGHYEWDKGDGQKEIIPARDIVHHKWMPDPLQPWRGLAPLLAVAREVDTDNEITKYIFALLKNDAIPRTIIQAPADSVLDDDQVKRMKQQFRELYGGEHRGDVAVLEGGATVSRLSLDMQELAADALRRVPEARIAAAFRVPPILAGLNVGLERSTYSNFQESVRAFTERTLVPLWRIVEDEITADLLPDFGGKPGQVVKFDLSSVSVLEESRAQEWERVNQAVKAGWLTINEARARIGYSPVSSGDVFIRTLTQVPEPAEPVLPSKAKALPADSVDGEYKVLPGPRELAETLISVQLRQRRDVASRMEAAVEAWFGGLADRVVHRALTWKGGKAVKQDEPELPEAEELLPSSEFEQFEEEVVRRFYLELLQLSWDTWNLALGVDVAFDAEDVAVTETLASAGTRIRQIHETTLRAIRELLVHAHENGWSIDHIVRGDRDTDVPGLRQIVEETYRNRARTIARTELGTAQNLAGARRFQASGVTKTLILDDGVEDSAPGCIVLGNGGKGTIVPTEWYAAHPLGHPNCLRCGAPYLGDEPVDEGQLAAWAAAGGDQF